MDLKQHTNHIKSNNTIVGTGSEVAKLKLYKQKNLIPDTNSKNIIGGEIEAFHIFLP